MLNVQEWARLAVLGVVVVMVTFGAATAVVIS